MFRRNRRRNPFARSAPDPIMQSTGVQAHSRATCAGCKAKIEVGEQFTRVRLRKRYAKPCVTCNVTPKRSRRFHTRCVPPDPAKFMGFDAAAHAAAQATHAQQAWNQTAHTAAPPPKPPSYEELALASLSKLEETLLAAVQQRKVKMTPELDKEFKTYQGIKSRALRPGTPAEGTTATYLAIQRLVKLVFVN